jgi:hypothetical protein
LYARLPRLLEQLRIARGERIHKRRLMALAKVDVLVLDDWALQPLESYGREGRSPKVTRSPAASQLKARPGPRISGSLRMMHKAM